ncbi:GHKL domain-containing protein [Geobacter sp. FeAm09]|uniref:two-component system sensor histidine kinase NtrB n=1 Tax=Geobacter sp. FeAm09 TaxID=2597769 RepID=UPI0011EDAF5D|nr:ATP-binding protein [Geobacter sp. FeAm09]QEM68063.1 GHKL domain-containing protein [Geobacter sp. FeAm09]
MLKLVRLACGAGITLFILWFAMSNYRDARPIAEDNLFGLAHSLHAAIENSVLHDPSLHSLATFHAQDLAYFALVDKNGVYRFHSNQELIGTRLQNSGTLRQLFAETMVGTRVKLATGETAYELYGHIHTPRETMGLRLVLHTYRADGVIRHARLTMIVLFALVAVGWFLTFVIYRYSRREEVHRQEMAQRENLAKMGEMGAMLAHEIRNPLAGIKGFAQLIEKRPDDPRTKESAQRIVGEARRLESLVTDLLAFARSDGDEAGPCAVARLMGHSVDLIRPEAEQARVALVIDCPSDLMVTGKRDRLGQVLLNIVKNGVQAMPDGGELRLTARQAGSQAIITINDTGHGISPENSARIFTPFFTTKARGTGLGLALCKKIVEEHHGSITVESSASGTTVTVTLPGAWTGEKP